MVPKGCVTIVGGGLAGTEAAWQAAERGVPVRLFEMRPSARTPAHQTHLLAELVCSNSLKSQEPTSASGLLHAEAERMGSIIQQVARAHAVPAGTALAVDRTAFAQEVTRRIEEHPLIDLHREEVTAVPAERPVIIATGPLTSSPLAENLQCLFRAYLEEQPSSPARGARLLYFYDAISPILATESVDRRKVFAASRYGKGGEDYWNCPMTEEEYEAFWRALVAAELYPLHDFEDLEEACFFEGCLPLEELARRGKETLLYGPLKPMGLTEPRTGRRPCAVVQLRREDKAGQMVNMVGCQTRLRRGEQQRIFRMIPGLAQAEFLRYGSLHRNTYIPAPILLEPALQFKGDKGLFIAGQLIGVEGYLESMVSGLLAGINAARFVQGLEPLSAPGDTMLGALLRYITSTDPSRFQPMNANFGLLPPLEARIRDRRERHAVLARRSREAMEAWTRIFA
ncbi:MAG: methylenetetrahydrofolate--tRNA-(uracil(54)-C(5))-methyltransferase (FADH(2)-oxidizing) TrmFO [candidate division NC10 bacterium]|jgi:methylenetetrahydrofolate--tRNA-(uracil-5-)-methyltransferase|nr:methylenetetrahydrofolate--tRNA-(uracil(54)-C(5))-methyltransferase (FADH(2)-oxidizing) TrmFO [candidate division NC10 bacterium]MCZ6551338.1 methylenetetrahydrofolate--tRNA-(uracil(54)-C(5))-methyltransferase (FADH(2)-oxidizing) TrmFO [candidate division NC10 bacterium]